MNRWKTPPLSKVEAADCWRCDSVVTKKELKQWYFKITAYADRLLVDLDTIDWPERIKTMQRNWIGRSEGAAVDFAIGSATISVFTTRPDTLYGVTFLALAPEHPLVAEITTEAQQTAVTHYIAQSQKLSEIERLSTEKEKSGVFSGAYARHPLTGKPVPIWIADYVLVSYGAGAVMGVPGHDSRDYAFAERFGLPIIPVVVPPGRADSLSADYKVAAPPGSADRLSADYQVAAPLGARTACPPITKLLHSWECRQPVRRLPVAAPPGSADSLSADYEVTAPPGSADSLSAIYEGEGVLINSGSFSGMASQSGGKQIVAKLAAAGNGRFQTSYRLRDWLISPPTVLGRAHPHHPLSHLRPCAGCRR
ncbi:MAG: class I tRNA ligase family protein [Chloroflexi bacterium]|nr:class I tRNA ligase family protein [Chloroflexota bacterium]